MKNLLLSTFLLSLAFSSFSQTEENIRRNAAFLELGGPGLFSSVNYERQLSKNPGFSVRAGLGFYSETDVYITYNLGFHFLFPLNTSKNAFIDLGVGGSLAREYLGISESRRDADQFLNIVPGLSYRKHFDKDTFFRAGINAVLNENGVIPWLNLAIGRLF